MISGQDWTRGSDTWWGLALALVVFGFAMYALIFR